MKSRHDKEVLGFKGQFRSKGGNSGQSSPMQTKSNMSVKWLLHRFNNLHFPFSSDRKLKLFAKVLITTFEMLERRSCKLSV